MSNQKDFTVSEMEIIKGATPSEDRIVTRAFNGELVTYTREEYGVGKFGLGPNIKTRFGHVVYVLAIAGIIAVFLYMPLQRFLVEQDSSAMAFLIVPLSLMALEFFAVRNLKKEWKAHKLREERGLPHPAH